DRVEGGGTARQRATLIVKVARAVEGYLGSSNVELYQPPTVRRRQPGTIGDDGGRVAMRAGQEPLGQALDDRHCKKRLAPKPCDVQILQPVRRGHIGRDAVSDIGSHHALQMVLITVSAAEVAVQGRADGEAKRVRGLEFRSPVLSRE